MGQEGHLGRLSPSPGQGRGAPASLTERVAGDTQWTQDSDQPGLTRNQPGLTRTLPSPHTGEIVPGATGRFPVSPSRSVRGGGELRCSDQGPVPWMSTKAGNLDVYTHLAVMRKCPAPSCA